MVQRRREAASESQLQNKRHPIYVSIYQISSLKRHEDDKRTFRKEKKLTFRRIKKNELRISERENREEEEEKKEEEKNASKSDRPSSNIRHNMSIDVGKSSRVQKRGGTFESDGTVSLRRNGKNR